MPMIARLKAMDHRLNEAAYDLYATRLRCFRLITLPLLAPGIVTGAMLAFIVSFDNFIITLMVAGAGGTTLPLYIYGLVKTQMTPELNAISTGVLLLSFGLLTAAFVLTRGRILGVSGMSE
jgi:spermidine/putrescine transport system permease protein